MLQLGLISVLTINSICSSMLFTFELLCLSFLISLVFKISCSLFSF
jgi:hypothetical protein